MKYIRYYRYLRKSIPSVILLSLGLDGVMWNVHKHKTFILVSGYLPNYLVQLIYFNLCPVTIFEFYKPDIFFNRQTEQYFQALFESSKRWSGPGGMVGRKEQVDKSRELRQRQKWLVNFSAQVNFQHLFPWRSVAKQWRSHCWVPV